MLGFKFPAKASKSDCADANCVECSSSCDGRKEDGGSGLHGGIFSISIVLCRWTCCLQRGEARKERAESRREAAIPVRLETNEERTYRKSPIQHTENGKHRKSHEAQPANTSRSFIWNFNLVRKTGC